MKFLRLTVVLFVLSLIQPSIFAYAESSQVVSVNATVPDRLSLDIEIHEGEPDTGPVVQQMNFGELISSTPGAPLKSETYFTILLSANSSSRRFKMTQSARPLSNGSDILEPGACLMVPWPVDMNGNNLPPGHTVDSTPRPFPSDSGSQEIYLSDPDGTAVMLPVVYVINSEEITAQGQIPFDQPAGQYSSQIVFQLELVS